jgi:MFS family permease
MVSSDSSPSESTALLSPPRDHDTNGDPEYSSPDSQDSLVVHISKTDLIWVLTGLWSAVFLGALDGKHNGYRSSLAEEPLLGTIVATLATPIGNHFHKSNQASYIGTSYLLSMCCFTPLYGTYSHYRQASIRAWTNCAGVGRLSDIVGRRGAMLLGLTLFGWLNLYL